MKLLIASDLHGSAYSCRRLLEALDRERAPRMLLLGDLLYHGPRNALPQEYDPPQTSALLNANKNRLLCVRGNCDAEVDQMVLEFPILPEFSLLDWGGRTVYATHGHTFNTKTPPPLLPGDILLHGHTHIPAWEAFGQGNLYLNPGSAAIPKNGSASSYLLLDGETLTWKNLDGAAYHAIRLN